MTRQLSDQKRFHDLATASRLAWRQAAQADSELSVEGRPHKPEWSARPVQGVDHLLLAWDIDEEDGEVRI